MSGPFFFRDIMTKTKTKKTPSKAYEYAVKFLNRKPEASYQDIKQAAAKMGIGVHQIVYGRAKLAAGLTGKPTTKPKPAQPATVRRPKVVANGHDDPIKALRAIVDENKRLKAILEKIRGIAG